MSRPSYRRLRPILYVSLTAALAIVPGMGVLADHAGADPQSLPVDGSIKSHSIIGPACTSPAGRCFVATFKGTLQGSAEFVANSVTPTSQPGMMLINGNFLIHDNHGDLACIEDSLLNTAPESNGEFVFLCEITGGTGKWAGASGYLQATGRLEATEGTAHYIGEITFK